MSEEFNKKFIEQQRNALLKEKERLTAQIEKLEKYPDYGDFEEDTINELQDYENNMSIDDELNSVLDKVNAALSAIDNGTYGRCSKCQEVITENRLEIIPYADICVSCESEDNE